MQAPDELIDGRWASDIVAALPERIHQAVAECIAEAPEAEALVDDEIRWTYRDLGAAVERTRTWLMEQGLRPGDRLLAVSENGRALVCLLLAASSLDVWIAIVNARLSARDTDAIRDNCEPRRSIYTAGASPDAGAHAARHGAAEMDVEPLGRIALSGLGAVERAPVERDGARQVAVMIYTSGTTGAPKGVMLTHRGVLYIARISGGMRSLRPGQRVYGVLPCSHVFGLSSVCLGALTNGATLYPVARFDAAVMVDTLERERITVLQGVPAMYARTLEYLVREHRAPDFPALVYTSAGGAPLDLDLKRRSETVFGTTLHNGYGLTEASPTVAQTRVGDRHETNTVGKVLPLLEYRLIDANGAEVPPGEVGELWTRGPNTMRGYYRGPGATADTLTDDGWLDTGDLARLDEHGNLYIVGRSKELIIRSGFNVYPPDVEAVLHEHPEVTLSAVVGRRVPGNEEVIAYVQRASGSDLTAEALAAFAAERLSAYKRPQRIVFMDQLPATVTGKIIKARLREDAES